MRAVITIIFLLFFVCSNSVYGKNADLAVKEAKIEEGLPFFGILKIWPIEENKFSAYESLENSFLGENLYISKISKITKNQNNQDVLEIWGTFIVVNYQGAETPVTIIVETENIPLSIKAEIVPTAPVDEKQDYFYKTLLLNKSQRLIFLILVFLVILALSGLIIYRKNKKKKLKIIQDKRALGEYWNSLFQDAYKREQYEGIIARSSEWLALLPVEETPDNIKVCLETVKKYQYQKNWSDEIFINVREAFDQIRNIFKGYGI